MKTFKVEIILDSFIYEVDAKDEQEAEDLAGYSFAEALGFGQFSVKETKVKELK